jgi:5-methylcytosine-specific restriction endonuclease McrA
MLSEVLDIALKPVERRIARKWPTREEIRAFYRSPEWKQARYEQLARSCRCAACGASPRDGARMNVDHIKPLHKRWDLRLKPRNLQTLCASCNWGKGATEKDWRKKTRRSWRSKRQRKAGQWQRARPGRLSATED